VTTRASRTSWVIAVALLALLVALGTLQHRWLSQISDAERERTLSRMQSAAGRFATDFDRELTRAFVTFVPRRPDAPDDAGHAARAARWEREAAFPDLVRAVLVAHRATHTGFELSRLDRETGRFTPAEWPAELSGLRDRLEHRHGAATAEGPGRRGAPFVAAADVPALVVPLLPSPPPPSDEPHGRRAGAERGVTIIWLSREAIEHTVLPELTARHFGGARGVEYHVEVADADDPRRVVFRAGPGLADGARPRARATAEVFALLPPSAVRTMDAPPPPRTRPQWRLAVADPSGALETAVARTQRRNLAVGFGILLLLAMTMAMLLVTTHRSRRLAQQQVEFVAGVTHELRTPLAAMRAAAQNLADGVIREPGRVTAYGALIDREARRLGEMVDHVLEFAGMQSGRATLDREPVAVGKLIEEAVAECRPTLEDKAVRVHTECGPLPPVMGDAHALKRALVNLIVNAVKYGPEGGTIAVRARAVDGSRTPRVEVTVEDQGPGIPAAELPHIFEPFYRGRGRSAGAVPGSGLGLTLVRSIAEAHGGRVTVQTGEHTGTAFTLHLPASS
jgi:signal transduction histidine kinase